MLIAPETDWGQLMDAFAQAAGMFDFAGRDKPYWNLTDMEDPDLDVDARCHHLQQPIGILNRLRRVRNPTISVYDFAGASEKVHSILTPGFSYRRQGNG